MSLDLTPSQRLALDSIGIEQWQLRAPVSISQATSHQIDDPALIEQLNLAIDYCSRATKRQLTWQVDPEANSVIITDSQLNIPPLSLLFSDAKLKQQLWQQLATIS